MLLVHRLRGHVGDEEIEARRLVDLHPPLVEIDGVIGLVRLLDVGEIAGAERRLLGPALGEGETVAIGAGGIGCRAQLDAVFGPGRAGMVDGDLGDGHAHDMLGADAVAEALVEAADDQDRGTPRHILDDGEGIGRRAGARDLDDGEIAALLRASVGIERNDCCESSHHCQRIA